MGRFIVCAGGRRLARGSDPTKYIEVGYRPTLQESIEYANQVIGANLEVITSDNNGDIFIYTADVIDCRSQMSVYSVYNMGDEIDIGEAPFDWKRYARGTAIDELEYANKLTGRYDLDVQDVIAKEGALYVTITGIKDDEEVEFKLHDNSDTLALRIRDYIKHGIKREN